MVQAGGLQGRAGGGSWQWWGYMNTSVISKLREVTTLFTQHLLCHINCVRFWCPIVRDISERTSSQEATGMVRARVLALWGEAEEHDLVQPREERLQGDLTAVLPMPTGRSLTRESLLFMKIYGRRIQHSGYKPRQMTVSLDMQGKFSLKNNYAMLREAVQFPSLEDLRPTWVRP